MSAGPGRRIGIGALLAVACTLLVSAWSMPAGAASVLGVRAADDAPATLRIHYVMPEAGAVALVWGVNGWQVPDDVPVPSGTTIANGVFVTPMEHQDGAFVARLTVTPGTTVETVFNIRETVGGRPIDVWDTRPHTLQAAEAGTSATTIAADWRTRVRVYASTLDPRLHWPIALLFVLACSTMFLPGRVTAGFDRLGGHRRAPVVMLVAVLLLGAGLRLVSVREPLVDFASWRQSSTAMMAQHYAAGNWNIFMPGLTWNGPEVSYQGRELQTVSYLTGLAWRVVGQHESVGRLIATLFGVWGIFALFQLIRRVWDEPRALVGAAAMAVLPGSIYVERSFLPDPAMVALMTTCAWLLVAYLQTARRSMLVLGTLVGAWGACSKLPGLIIGLPAAYAVVTIAGWPGLSNIRRYRPLLIAAAGVLLPTIVYYLWARHLSMTYPPYHFAGQGNWLWDVGLEKWLGRSYFWSELSWHLTDWLWTMPGLALVVVGLVLPPPSGGARTIDGTARTSATPADVRWFFHWWALGFAAFYLIGAQELIQNGWNFHLLNPAAAALIGHAVVSLTARITGWRTGGTVMPRILLAGLMLLVVASVGQIKLRQTVTRPVALSGFELGLALRRISQPDDLVVTVASTPGDPVAIYYSRRRGWVFPPDEGEGASLRLPDDDEQMIRQFDALRGRHARWFGLSQRLDEDSWAAHTRVRAYISRTCAVVEENSVWMVCRILTPAEVAQLDAHPRP